MCLPTPAFCSGWLTCYSSLWLLLPRRCGSRNGGCGLVAAIFDDQLGRDIALAPGTGDAQRDGVDALEIRGWESGDGDVCGQRPETGRNHADPRLRCDEHETSQSENDWPVSQVDGKGQAAQGAQVFMSQECPDRRALHDADREYGRSVDPHQVFGL